MSINAEETPIIHNGIQIGIIQKYYKYGLWNYRSIIFKINGIISGNFYDKETAIAFIEKNKEDHGFPSEVSLLRSKTKGEKYDGI